MICKNLYKNRLKVIDKLENNSVALISSNIQYYSNADTSFPYKPNTDLLYLTNISEKDTILLLYKKNNKSYEEILFIKNFTEREKVWIGEGLDLETAKKTSGINKIKFIDDFEDVLNSCLIKSEYVYINSNENRVGFFTDYANKQLISKIKKNYPLHNYRRLAPILRNIRTLKEEYEIDLIKESCAITKDAFMSIAKKIKPNIYEYEIEAEFIYDFKKQNAQGFAYDPIIAWGKNACTLHYIKNNSQLRDGDLLLMDIGVKNKNYNSDVTRVFPVNGKFTKRQKDVYNSVLQISKETKKLIKLGMNFSEYNTEVNKIVGEELIKLKLIKNSNDNNEIKKYFMHGVSHHLGLDVHDNCNYDIEFSENMVMTIEPGIYIPEENIGIRLEDDIVIKKNKILNLTESIPLKVEEIENIMKSS